MYSGFTVRWNLCSPMASLNRSRIIFGRILIGTERIMMPRQFLYCPRSSFLESFTRCPFFQSAGTIPSVLTFCRRGSTIPADVFISTLRDFIKLSDSSQPWWSQLLWEDRWSLKVQNLLVILMFVLLKVVASYWSKEFTLWWNSMLRLSLAWSVVVSLQLGFGTLYWVLRSFSASSASVTRVSSFSLHLSLLRYWI